MNKMTIPLVLLVPIILGLIAIGVYRGQVGMNADGVRANRESVLGVEARVRSVESGQKANDEAHVFIIKAIDENRAEQRETRKEILAAIHSMKP